MILNTLKRETTEKLGKRVEMFPQKCDKILQGHLLKRIILIQIGLDKVNIHKSHGEQFL